MAKNTLIRNDKPHEVKLDGKSKVAQSRKADTAVVSLPPKDTATDAQVPETPIPKRLRPSKAPAKAAAKKEAPRAAKATGSAAARTASLKKGASDKPAAAARQRSATPKPAAPATPRLPARVPADGLWEADSSVMQRLNALVERNARLSEQIQRLQQGAPLKGFQP